MKVEELKKVHPLYNKNTDSWKKFRAAYEGFEELAATGFFHQNPRESSDNYKIRLKEGYGPNYSEAVINIFDYFVRQSKRNDDYGSLPDNKLWELFAADTDYDGTDYKRFWERARKMASIYGMIGVIVDMPKLATGSLAESVEKKIYPFLSVYYPQSILDWEWDTNAEGRPELVYLKLKEKGGKYRIWKKDSWELWAIVDGKAESQGQGTNPLAEIPFCRLFNEKADNRMIGVSDIKNIADIDISIDRNIMAIEEVINLAAFPMMRKPMRKRGKNGEEDRTGVTAILEFDPSQGDAGKPDWLESKVKEPIEAIMGYIAWKIQEINRNAMLNDVSAEATKSAQSGTALKIKRELLYAALNSKTLNQVEAEKKSIRLWLKWIGKEAEAENISIQLSTSFSADDMKMSLENAILTKSFIHSESFSKNLQKKISRQILGSDTSSKELEKIDKEVDSYVEPEPTDGLPDLFGKNTPPQK